MKINFSLSKSAQIVINELRDPWFGYALNYNRDYLASYKYKNSGVLNNQGRRFK